MTAGDCLLRAILENPADDLPRLVYADYLDENGQSARAEFIRVQVELATISEPKHKRTWYPEQPTALTKYGDRHYSFCGYPDENFQIGDRIDLLVHIPLKKPKMKHGFRCYKIADADEGSGELEVYVRLDADSKPWAGAELAKREEHLLHKCDYGRGWRRFAGDAVKIVPDGASYADHIRFTRGFVSSISLPLASFTEAVARELFSRMPVTSVRLTDREPGEYEDYQAVWHRWMCGPETETLPDTIFDLLQGGEVIDTDMSQGVSIVENFRLTTKAVAAASLACVAWGRSLANLSPLSISGNSSTIPLTG